MFCFSLHLDLLWIAKEAFEFSIFFFAPLEKKSGIPKFYLLTNSHRKHRNINMSTVGDGLVQKKVAEAQEHIRQAEKR